MQMISTPYLTVPFKLSDDSWEWARKTANIRWLDYQKNGILPSALISLTLSEQSLWRNSPAWEEITSFCEGYGLYDGDPQLFLYKQLERPLAVKLGNPHIDTGGLTGDNHDVPVRFNILLEGDDDQEMFWWDIKKDDPRLEVETFIRPNGTWTHRVQAKGKSRASQYQNLGSPTWRNNTLFKLNNTSSFVRTDILHSINWDGQRPRIILSVRFLQPWDELNAS
jgi:hypothetical protein